MNKRIRRTASCLLCLAMLWSVIAPTAALASAEEDDPAVEVTAGMDEELPSSDTQTPPDPAEETPADEEEPSEEPSGEEALIETYAGEVEEVEYEIYPTPHSVTYQAGTVTLPATMQVTYGDGIDVYTKDRAVEAFEQAGVTLSDSASTSVKLQVRIKGATETVSTSTANLFDKTGAYKLVIDANGVTVVGKDTDAAFYGLTTVKRILEQVKNGQVRRLTVEDYADVAFRGFIEGYYGQPWTTEDRVKLMEFGGEFKMNIYFYAPKNDPKHNEKWREKYTEEELAELITPLAQAGERSKCRFGYALHCFMSDPFKFDTEANYQADLEVLKAKYEQGIKAGARQIALLADDAGAPGGALGSGNSGGDGYVKLLKDLTDWLASDEMQTKYPGLQTTIPFCPEAYGNGTGNHAQLTRLNDAPEGVSIIMTGGQVYGTVNSTFLSAFKNNVGRGAYLWINWPCSDNVRARIMMLGQDKFLKTGIDPDTLEGIMLNPMQQSEPSKVGLFCNADYTWNLWTDEQHGFDVWNDSFKYVENMSATPSEEADAFRLLSQHMGYNIDSRPPKTDESQDMWPLMTAFRSAMASSSLTDTQIDKLKAEYQKLYDAVLLLKNKDTGNMRILGKRDPAGGYPKSQEQLLPWLDCAEEFTLANVELLDALKLIYKNSDGSKDSEIVDQYLSAQSHLTASQNHDFWSRSGSGDFTVKPEFGGQRLIPFANDLLSVVAETAKTILNPSVLTETIITSRSDVTDLSALRDGKDSTSITFKTPASLSEGDYIGVRYNRPIAINSVNFKLGDSTADNGKNTFGACKLQYTEDGKTWLDIPGEPTIVNNTKNSGWSGSCRVAEIGISGLSLNAKGVRVVSTEDVNDVWIVVREIYINGQSGEVEAEPETATGQLTGTVIKSSRLEVHEGPESNLTDGNDSTTVWYKETGTNKDASIVGDYLGLDLGRVVKNVGRVRFVVGNGSSADKWTNFKLQYSTDNTNWTDAGTFSSSNNQDVIEADLGGVAARYVRFVNTVQVNKWLYFAELSVWADGASAIIYQSDAVKKLTNPVGDLTDDSAALRADNVSLRPGEFVGIALPRIRQIVELIADYTPTPGLVLKVGMSEASLVEVETYVGTDSGAVQLLAANDAVTDFTGFARYIRLENVSKKNVSFRLNKLSVRSEEIGAIHYEEEMSDMDFDASYGGQDNREGLALFDGDISTTTTLAHAQTAGEYVTYDLGQLRPIKKLVMAMPEGEKNYLRHGVLEVSPDGENWTVVVSVNNNGAYNSEVRTINNIDPAFQLGVPSQNYGAFVGELGAAVDARYLRIRVTADGVAADNGNINFIAACEILINCESFNDMEYVRAFNDPTFETDPIEPSADFTPDKMIDGDLTTGFRPNMEGKTSGYLIYRFSDVTSIGQINIVQDTANPSNATVEIRTADGWQTISGVTLNKGLNQIMIPEDVANVLEIKLTWGNVTPTFYEMITVPRAAAGGGQAASDPETIPINSYSGADRVFNFDENWKFNLGDASGASAAVYNDAAWRTVNLPHDFSIEQDYTSAGEAESGYLPGGTGWYRKSFTIDSDWENKKVISIDFGGAYMETEVYLNGTKLGENKNGYNPFSFVLPGNRLNYTGENVIAVKVVNTIPSSRWYSGSGIYRSVNLTVTDAVHVARYGTYVNPVKGDGNSWTVNVKTTVENSGSSAASVTVEQTIYELDSTTYKKKDTVVATVSGTAAPAANGTANVTQSLSVSSPKLWNSWDRGTPNLYVLVTTVKKADGTVLDTYETEFGFRTIEFTVNEGFKLNGVNTKLKGVCQHHDQGALGAEAWYRAMERQVEILMDMGCNSIRVTHNPAADELIEICNRKGILIIDEAFDCWDRSKNGNSYDFARFFNVTIASDNAVVGGAGKTWAQFVLESMVNRDKNAPCVIMYSLGNEILATSPHEGFVTIAQNLVDWTEAIDTTRPVTMGDDTRTNTTGSSVAQRVNTIIAQHGVIGFNYCYTRTTQDRDKMPGAHANNWLLYGSEVASHINSRGVYNTKSNETLNSDKLLTSYDKSRVGWGDTVAGAWWYTIRFDYNMGEYIWTGFDYIGEPTPANDTGSGWKNGWATDAPKSSYFGAIDTNGLPKDSFWLYRALWNESDTTLHVLPTWDKDDLVIENGKVEVVVYSNAPVVRVYLNGVEVGASQAEEITTPNAGHKYRVYNALALSNGGTNTFQPGSTAHVADFSGTAMYSTFMIPYQAGKLEVKAFDANGREITNTVGRNIVRTTSGASKLVTEADRATIKNDGRDLSYVTISITDKNGEIVNGATDPITVSVSGDGVFMGMDNGVQPDHTSYLSKTMKAGAGQLVAIVQSTKDEGEFTLTATADGLAPASVTVKTSGAVSDATGTAPVSYDLSKTIYVQLNTDPDLPETTEVNLADGTKVTKNIIWDAYVKSLLSTAGNEFTITGKIADYNIAVSVGVLVLDDIVALLNYSTAIQPGTALTLPAARPAVMADGTVVNAQFPVTWDMPTEKQLSKPGTVIVDGKASDVFGKELEVTATVRIANPSYVEGSEAVVGTAVFENGEGKGLLATYAPAYADHNASTFVPVQGAIGYSFDTAQNIYKITLTYNGTPPIGGVTIAISGTGYLTAEANGGWQTVRATGVVSGNTVTYQLDKPVSTESLKFTFSNQVKLADILLTNGLSVFPIGTTAEFDGLKVNGQDATSAQLAAKVIKTSAENAIITPVSDDNVAVTILPENSNSQIIVVTESEDHTSREVYTVQLDAPVEADDDSNDYPYTKTTVSTPSEQTPADKNVEGPKEFAVDNNPSTYWHSKWSEDLSTTPEKRYIQLTLEEAAKLTALRYKPRPSIANGIVTKYRVEVSTDGTNFTKVAEGDWAHDTTWKIAEFDEVVTAKYVRLYGVETRGASGNPPNAFMSCAELRVVAVDDRIDLSAATISILKDGQPFPGPFHWKNLDLRPGAPTHSNVDDDITVTVTLYGKVLQPGVDYELDYDNNVDPGTAYLYARALANSTEYQGAAATQFKIEKTEDKITSFQPVILRIYPGVAPELPTEVLVTKEDQHRANVAVSWDDVPEKWYFNPNYEELEAEAPVLTGSIEDEDMLKDPELKPTLTPKFIRFQSADTVSLVTLVGAAPELPETVTVRFADGTSAERSVTWNTAGKDWDTADTVVTVTGDIVGVASSAATATVRVAESSGTTYVPDDDNIALNTSSGSSIFPLALAYWSSGNNNPYQAIKGQSTGSTAATDRWSDWERNTYHTGDSRAWMGVAFETSTQDVAVGQNQTLTLVPHKVNQVKVMFVDEDGTGGAVTFPDSYKIQYYTGPVTGLSLDTRLSAEDQALGNGRVRDWTNSPLNDSNNWSDVDVTGSQPTVPSSNGQMLTVNFEPVNTAIIRVLCTPKSNKWSGIQALEVYEAKEIVAPPTANADFTVTSITLDGAEKKDDFDANKVLSVELAAGAAIPTLAVTAEGNPSIAVTQASGVPGAAQAGGAWAAVTITSEDGSKTETYTVKFTREGATSGYFIDLDVPAADAEKLDITPNGGAAGTEITVSVDRGYQLTDLWVQILDGAREGEFVSIKNGKFLMPAGNVSFSARVSPITYKITYQLNDGTVSSRNLTSYTVETASFTLRNPTRSGYTFLGWVGSGLSAPTQTVTISKGSIGDRTYIAVWSAVGSGGDTPGTSSGGGGGGGGGSSAPVGNVVTTTTNPSTGAVTVTTAATNGVVTAVTTGKNGAQSAVIQIPEKSSSVVEAVMPPLDAAVTPEVKVQNNTNHPVSLTIPMVGGETVVAVRLEADGSETVIPLSVVDEDGLRLKAQPGDQTIRLMDNKKTFTDVPADYWGANAVDFVSSRELFNGMGSADTFAPTLPMNRAMMTTVLWRLAEKPEAALETLFDDVQPNSYYEEAVAWGVATGVVKGTDFGFEPDSPVTRETMATLLYRSAGSPAVVDEMPRRFSDGALVSDWAQAAVAWCIANDIIRGRADGTIDPKAVATRAEVAAMLQRFVNQQV